MPTYRENAEKLTLPDGSVNALLSGYLSSLASSQSSTFLVIIPP